MNLTTRLFKDEDLEQIESLQKLYEDIGYPTNKKELKDRLKKLNNRDDYYLLLLLKDNKIIGLSGMCKMLFFEKMVNI